MNTLTVLREALPDVPPLRMRETYPCLHPKLVVREHMEREGRLFHIIVPGNTLLFRFTPQQYQLAQLFDGKRNPAQIAALFRKASGVNVSEETVRRFGESLDKSEFWYRTPQEDSALLCDKLMNDRHAHVKKSGGGGDLSTIHLLYFDPDRYLTWLHDRLRWVYTEWFALWSIFMLGVMVVILGARWGEVWSDTLLFYNVTQKNVWDFVEFFAIFLALITIHETSHGITCKHFGGESHRMGLFLVYLIPAMFCEVSQVYVYGGRRARVMTIAAGVVSELIVCSYVSVVWWFTQPGTLIHELCYKLILSGGIFVIFVNWNPLTKLDGYFLMCELLRFFDLRGQSTALTSALMRKHIFRMPATVPALPLARKIGFVFYAVVAGAYSYFVLFFFVRVLYRIAMNWSPEWAFVPAALLALKIFKSRIKKFGEFMKVLYLDKKELLVRHRPKLLAAAAALAVFALLPLWRESVKARFVLQTSSRAVLRAQVPGMVTEVAADEGQRVQSGAAVARLRDLESDTELADLQARFQMAGARATQASLRYVGFGPAEQERDQLARKLQIAVERSRQLTITTPISGVIATPHARDLLGTYVPAGTVIAEVADDSTMRADIYVPETDFRRVHDLHNIVLRMDASWNSLPAVATAISPLSREVDPGIAEHSKYTGVHELANYVVTATLPNATHQLKDGMTGTAKIFGPRRSLAGLLFEPVRDAFDRRVW